MSIIYWVRGKLLFDALDISAGFRAPQNHLHFGNALPAIRLFINACLIDLASLQFSNPFVKLLLREPSALFERLIFQRGRWAVCVEIFQALARRGEPIQFAAGLLRHVRQCCFAISAEQSNIDSEPLLTTLFVNVFGWQGCCDKLKLPCYLLGRCNVSLCR